jgi:hypothetical protein
LNAVSTAVVSGFLELMGPWLSRNFDLWQKKGRIKVPMLRKSDLIGFEPCLATRAHYSLSSDSIPSQHDYGDYDDVKNDDENGGSDDGIEDDLSGPWCRPLQPFQMTMPGDSPQHVAF